MLRVSSLLRGSRRKGQSVLPKEYSRVQASAAGSSWGAIGRMSSAQKEDVLHGAWRSVHETVLRDNTALPHSTPSASDASSEGASAVAPDELTFPTSEDADAFMKALHEAQDSESRVPVMELTRSFYDELAKTANDEIDAEGDAEAPAEEKSDEERAEEANDIQRQFFADFYVAQGLLTEPKRSEFLRTMTSEPESYLVADPTVVLSRVVVRHELEQRAARGANVAHVEWMDGAFVVRPHQDEPPVEDDVASLPLFGGKEEEEGAHSISSESTDGSSTPTLSAPADVAANREASLDAGMLAMLLDEDVLVEQKTVSDVHYNVDADALASLLVEDANTDFLSQPREAKDAVAVPHSEPPTALQLLSDDVSATPPVLSLLELQWLQRKISSGALIDTDLLGLVVPMLLVADVLAHKGGSRKTLTVATAVSRGDRLGNGNSGGDYMLDVARLLQHEEWVSTASGRTFVDYALVTVHRPPPPSAQPSRKRQTATSGNENGDAAVDDLLMVTPGDGTPAPPPGGSHTSFEVTSTRGTHFVDVHVPHRIGRPLKGLMADAVLCSPRSSGDGLRPRVTLSSDGKAQGRAAAHRAFDVVRLAAERCAAAQLDDLTYALSMLPPARSDGPRPRLVYAVNSMNPMECEAVVCAALQQLRTAVSEGRTRKSIRVVHPSRALATPAGDGDADVPGELIGLDGGWGNGRTEWMAAEGAPEFCDSDKVPISIRQEVAQAAWRLRPVEDRCNGAFVIILERDDVASSLPPLLFHEVASAPDRSPNLIVTGPPSSSDAHKEIVDDKELIVLSPHTRHLQMLAEWRRDARCVVVAGKPMMDARATHHIDLNWSADADAPQVVRLLEASAQKMSAVPPVVVELSTTWMLALLYCRVATNSMIEASRNYMQWRAQQRPAADGVVDAEVSADAMRLLRSASGGARSLWLTPRVPGNVHKLIAEELRSMMIVGRVVAGGADYSSWELRVDDNVSRHSSEVEERLVAVRDALCYVHRALGLPFHKDDVLRAVGVARNQQGHEADNERAARPTNHRRHPGANPRVSVVERNHHRKLQKLANKIRYGGGEVPGEGPVSWRRQS